MKPSTETRMVDDVDSVAPAGRAAREARDRIRELTRHRPARITAASASGLAGTEGTVEQHVDDAFDEVGVQDASRRTDRCPGANP